MGLLCIKLQLLSANPLILPDRRQWSWTTGFSFSSSNIISFSHNLNLLKIHAIIVTGLISKSL